VDFLNDEHLNFYVVTSNIFGFFFTYAWISVLTFHFSCVK